jgi:NhaA family Na+:H+ antiporter
METQGYISFMRTSIIAQFLKLEAASGIILFVMAIAALILCNSPYADLYKHLWQVTLAIHLGQYSLSVPLIFWVNEGLMTLFFLMVGLELNREFLEGELASVKQVILPAVAAVGGMLVPALIYCAINYHDADTIIGWAVPVATDIAFALGVLSLFGNRVPVGLKLFLMALAIFDDVGAILIIAIFHTASLSYWSFGFAILAIAVLILLNKCGVRRLTPYLLVGFWLWFCVLQSGVHATVAGVILAFVIPLKKNADETVGPAQRLEHTLHPWVAYLVMPLFAFANAGLSLAGLSAPIILDQIALGTLLGLLLGKQIGVFLFSWLAIRLKWAALPEDTTWLELYAVAILCGIGFTMSLFLGTLAFEGSNPIYLVEVRVGVLLGSLLSGVIGAGMLQLALLKKAGRERCRLDRR